MEQYEPRPQSDSSPLSSGGALLGAPRTPHSLGSIIWGVLLRMAIVMFAVWILRDFIEEYTDWWLVASFSLYGLAIYPAQVQYEYFRSANRRLIEGTLCSSCRHFRPENIHCTMHDEHVTEEYLPCEGRDWEPAASFVQE